MLVCGKCEGDCGGVCDSREGDVECVIPAKVDVCVIPVKQHVV